MASEDRIHVKVEIEADVLPSEVFLGEIQYWEDRPNAQKISGYMTGNLLGTAQIGGLTPDTTYKVRVRHMNSGGWSDWSKVVTVRTLSDGALPKELNKDLGFLAAHERKHSGSFRTKANRQTRRRKRK